MKREDWKNLEAYLRFPCATSAILVDGRKVMLQVRTEGMQMVIFVFVDGAMRGSWLDPTKPCPEQAFMRRIESYLWSKKERDGAARFAKRFGKREAKKYLGDMNKKYVHFSPYFPSVRAIRAQYEKTFKSIEPAEV
jgi:hypothetical protein